MITLENEFLLIEAKESGAELTRIYDKKVGRECLWTANPAVWNRHAPVLFPIVGSVRNKEYRHAGKTYFLGQHGFARDAVFTVTETCENSVTFTLTDSEETKKVYPFSFRLDLTYTLEGDQLHTDYKVTNPADETMYFSIGGHPGFLYDGDLHEQEIRFNSDEDLDRVVLNFEKGLFSHNIVKKFVEGGKPIKIDENTFARDAIVFHDFKFTVCDIVNANTGHGVSMDLTGFPYVGIWSKPAAPYACIEPWFGLADYEDFDGEIKDKTGIQTLPAGETFSCRYSVRML